MNADLNELMSNTYVQSVALLLGGLGAAVIARVVFFRILHLMSRRS